MSSGRIHEIEGAQAKAIDIDLSSENHGLMARMSFSHPKVGIEFKSSQLERCAKLVMFHDVSCVSTLRKLLQNETHEVEFLQRMASA